MSIFDILRYPISNPPTVEELRALPFGLFDHWVSISDWRKLDVGSVSADLVAAWYKTHWDQILILGEHQIDRDDVNLLKKIIKEYDQS